MKKEEKHKIRPVYWVISTAIFVIIFSLIWQADLQSENKLKILNPNQIYQSEVVVIELDKSLNPQNFELVIFGENYKFNKNRLAFVGIDIAQEPRDYPIYLINLVNLEKTNSSWIQVLKKDFPRLPFLTGTTGCESPVKEERDREQEAIRSALALRYGFINENDDGFLGPLDYIKTTGDFGVFRGNRQHKGVDLRGNGVNVLAVNSGVVLLAERFSLEGNLVVINHGGGVLSMYMHLSEIHVELWQEVRRGETIGLAGNTGCVTAPNLDFRIFVHGATVDPLNYISVVNKYSSR